MKVINFLSIYLILLITSISAFAQEDTSELPGNTELPSSEEELKQLASFDKGNYQYSVEDYFKEPNQSYFKLSPNGEYLSFMQMEEDGKSHVYVKHTATNQLTRVIEEKEQLILMYLWGNDNTLLYIMDKGGDENYHLYSYNLETKENIDLTPFEGVTLSTIYVLKNLPNYVIVPLNKRNPEIFEPYKINIESGSIELVYENTNTEKPIVEYEFDRKGNLRAFKIKNGVLNVWKYKAIGEDTFEELITTSWKEHFEILGFSTENKDIAYVNTNIKNDKNEIVLFDLKNKKIIEHLFSNDNYDLSGISRSRKRNLEVDYYYYDGTKETIVPVSNYFKKLYSKLEAEFAGNSFDIVSMTDNEDKMLIYVYSDILYGQYFQYDVSNDSFKKLMDLMPDLIPTTMAKMTPISFQTRDGLTIHGYLTLPNQAKKGTTPLIVIPHGGPYGERDSWGFNAETQLFASRGYASLQINFRGSGGYGKSFYLAGNKQVGRKMLEDLEDGVKYVTRQGFIDPNKIAIFGGSYGGLATLGAIMKTPELYACGVNLCGVSNFFTFVESFPAYWKPLMEQFYDQWYDPEIAEEKVLMEALSPALNIDKLNKPIFVIQGANDPRVNINESDQIVEGLRAKGIDVPYMVKYNEGHGFVREENKIDMYKVMLGFLAKNLQN